MPLPIASAPGIRPDAWLSDVLGYPVFAVTPDADVDASAGPGLWYAKVGVDDVAAVGRLEKQGFAVIDVNVTLRRDPGVPPSNGSSVEVGPARPAEHEELVDIAGGCFRYSRFHLDPHIPNELADRVKREWVRSYINGGRGIELLAARDGDRPVGFLAVLQSGPARVIDLIGVDPQHQGRGFGGALVSAFVERHGTASSELLVGTQIANVPSLRIYARYGFTIARAAYVLHRHGT